MINATLNLLGNPLRKISESVIILQLTNLIFSLFIIFLYLKCRFKSFKRVFAHKLRWSAIVLSDCLRWRRWDDVVSWRSHLHVRIPLVGMHLLKVLIILNRLISIATSWSVTRIFAFTSTLITRYTRCILRKNDWTVLVYHRKFFRNTLSACNRHLVAKP